MNEPISVIPPVISIASIGQYCGRRITIRGWLYNKRSSGSVRFLLVRDGTETVQCVAVQGEMPAKIFELVDCLTQESSLSITGLVREDKRSPLGYEMGIENITLHHQAQEYPISKKEHGVDFLMDHRHLWLRSSRQHAILNIRARIIRAVRDFLDARGFTLVDAPIFTGNACEGTTTLFKTDYFSAPAYLTQSGQLYMEAAAMAVGKAYCFGPVFRAENSNTRRHLTEFWMVEPEAAYFDLNDDMALAEELVAFIVRRILETSKTELGKLKRDTAFLEKAIPPFPRLTYSEAVDILHQSGEPFEWGNDLGSGHETLIAGRFDKPVLVHRYPRQCKAFYMKGDPENPALALCVDMLAPEGYGEIIGGGQREDDYDLLLAKIRDNHLPVEQFQWYLDLRKYGSVPHAGFGLGIERVIAWICGLPHVRETIPFPRMPNRLTP